MVSDQILRKWKLVQSLSRRPLKPLKGPLPRRCHIFGEHPELSHFNEMWQYQCGPLTITAKRPLRSRFSGSDPERPQRKDVKLRPPFASFGTRLVPRRLTVTLKSFRLVVVDFVFFQIPFQDCKIGPIVHRCQPRLESRAWLVRPVTSPSTLKREKFDIGDRTLP